jgi:hypothetical protein
MKKQNKIIAITIILFIAVGLLDINVLAIHDKPSKTEDLQIPIKEIAEYKYWLKVTPKPHKVEFIIDGTDN